MDRSKGSETFHLASDRTLHLLNVVDLVVIGPRREILCKARLPENPNDIEAHGPTRPVTPALDHRIYIGDFRGCLGTLSTSAQLAPGEGGSAA